MQRRSFLHAASAAIGLPLCFAANESRAASPVLRRNTAFSVDDNRVRIFTSAIKTPTRILMVADTHLFKDDQRGTPYHEFSARMAAAYNQTQHFETGKATNPEESFLRILDRAKAERVDLVALVGDIFSFPSEAAIDWVGGKLEAAKLPYLYIAGNHDWHYEGMPGSLDELRATWIEKRLKPLYQQQNPLMSTYDAGEVRVLAIDNSTYEILPEQLEFFRAEVLTGKPFVLTVHIPLYAPGRPMGFGCGNPGWGAKSDQNHELERRPRWRDPGHTQTTMAFHREVFAAPNLLGVFAGHIHRNSVDAIQGIPQFVTDDNASGAYLDVEVLPWPTG